MQVEHIFASPDPRGALKLKLCSLNPDAPPSFSGLTLAATEITPEELPPPPPPRNSAKNGSSAQGPAAMMAALMGQGPGGASPAGGMGAMMAMMGGQQSLGGASPEAMAAAMGMAMAGKGAGGAPAGKEGLRAMYAAMGNHLGNAAPPSTVRQPTPEQSPQPPPKKPTEPQLFGESSEEAERIGHATAPSSPVHSNHALPSSSQPPHTPLPPPMANTTTAASRSSQSSAASAVLRERPGLSTAGEHLSSLSNYIVTGVFGGRSH